MQFVAIDFETANNSADSACQLAAVKVLDGVIVAEKCWLIRPPTMYFSPRNIAIHGIRPADVKQSPTMEVVWGELQPLIEGEVVIAHNARFDVGVLVNSLAAVDVACPDFEFNCTRSLARSAWPGRTGYGLKPLGDWLGVSFQHHDALEDSRCCASIALAVAKTCEQTDLEALESALSIRRGSYRQGLITSPRSLRRSRTDSAEGGGRTTADRWGFPLKGAASRVGVDPGTVLSASAGELPLASRRFVFLGPLRGLTLSETIQLAESLGATCELNIHAGINYVVACGSTLEEASQLMCAALAAETSDTTASSAIASSTTASLATASLATASLATASLATASLATASLATASLATAGIRLLSERQFLALIPGGKASTRR